MNGSSNTSASGKRALRYSPAGYRRHRRRRHALVEQGWRAAELHRRVNLALELAAESLLILSHHGWITLVGAIAPGGQKWATLSVTSCACAGGDGQRARHLSVQQVARVSLLSMMSSLLMLGEPSMRLILERL